MCLCFLMSGLRLNKISARKVCDGTEVRLSLGLALAGGLHQELPFAGRSFSQQAEDQGCDGGNSDDGRQRLKANGSTRYESAWSICANGMALHSSFHWPRVNETPGHSSHQMPASIVAHEFVKHLPNHSKPTLLV